MHITVPALLTAAAILPTSLAQATFEKSSKRGLVFVPSAQHPLDNEIWVQSTSDLTWYYNYGSSPSPAYLNLSQDTFEFVPMLWGSTDPTFLSDVQTLIQDGTNISHVLTFNEPDGSTSSGGSNLDPAAAATLWIREVEPLRKLGVKTGAPAVTGSPAGFTWLTNFFAACAKQGTNCTADFIPIHWYGNFEGLTSHIGQVSAAYPNVSLWVTEYSLPNADLVDSQNFFNQSAEYFDRTSSIARYSYFGAFRSPASNVGPNEAMLDEEGQLTNIGSWYLGGAATNNIPNTAPATVAGAMWGFLLVAGVGFCFL